MESPPRKIGPYAVRDEIGRGGMGVVYAAYDHRLQRDIAIKALSDDFARDAERIGTFEREAQVIAQLNHPNIVQIYQLLKHEGHAYLVLEFVPGQSLARMIAEGPLGIRRTIDIAAQIARAVEAAHARSIRHRDLKPSNVRVRPDGTAKILDFGLAQGGPGAPGANSPRSGATGRIGGTPGYMAPEQLLSQPADGRADTFSLGCIIYECLTGARPFPGEDLPAIINATLHAEPDFSKIPDDLPRQILETLRRCLAKSASDRPERIAEVRTQLDALVGRHTPSSRSAPLPGSLVGLPRPRTSFVGRERTIRGLIEAIAGARLVTLIGSGGSGKTRLAIELALAVADRFPDGVFWIDLAPIRAPEFVASVVAGAIDVEDRPGTATIDAVADDLAGKTALLIFDNCEHVVDTVSEIIDRLLAGLPDLHVLATTRQRLHVQGERLWPVAGLSIPESEDDEAITESEAVRLFVDRARMIHPRFALTRENMRVIARLCQRLDGIPLAVEFAAARTRSLDPEEIESHLHDRFRLLTDDTLGVVDRFRTLRAAVDWSYDMLSESERRLLARLSVFAGGWSLESAEAVCAPCGNAEDERDLDRFALIDLLTNLADKSLVEVEHANPGTVRYRLLETIREYAGERLAESGEAPDVAARHLDYFVSYVSEASHHFHDDTQPESLARIEIDHENVLAALSREHSTPELAARAGRLCLAMLRFWQFHAHFKTGLAACQTVLSDPALRRGSDEHGGVLHTAAVMSMKLGELEQTARYSTEALAIARAHEDLPAAARSLNSLGNAAYYQGDFERAEPFHRESLQLNRRLGHDSGISGSLNNLANIAQDRGQLDKARPLYEEALAINRKACNLAAQAINLYNLGLIAFRTDRKPDARRLLGESRALRERIGDRFGIAETLCQLANIDVSERDPEGARPLCRESLRIRVDLGDKLGLCDSLDAVAALAAALGSNTRAAEALGAVEDLRSRIGATRSAWEQHALDEHLAPVRARLGDDAIASALAAARSRPLDPFLEQTLAWLASDPTPSQPPRAPADAETPTR